MSEDRKVSREELLASITPEQEAIIKTFSRMLGRLLTLVDATFLEPGQRHNFKKLVERDVYDGRNEVLKLFGLEVARRED